MHRSSHHYEPVAPELVHVLSEDVARPQRRDEVVELGLLAVHVALRKQFNGFIYALKTAMNI